MYSYAQKRNRRGMASLLSCRHDSDIKVKAGWREGRATITSRRTSERVPRPTATGETLQGSARVRAGNGI